MENRDYFSKLKQTYEKDLFETTEAVFDKLTKEKHDYWLTINRLQRLSDFLAITSFKLSERLKVEPREVKEVELKLRNLTSFDVNNVKNFLSKFKTEKINRLVTFQKAYTQKTPYIVPAVFHVDRHKIGLNDLLKEVYNLPVDRISLLSKMLSQSAKDITSISTDLQNLSRDVIDSTKEFADVSSQLSYVAGQYLASLNTDLQTIANTIATAVQSGISADLDSLAQGFGFGSFADAVAAYNAAYGTNYSVQEARDALAGK